MAYFKGGKHCTVKFIVRKVFAWKLPNKRLFSSTHFGIESNITLDCYQHQCFNAFFVALLFVSYNMFKFIVDIT
jgi:hypothetical protein